MPERSFEFEILMPSGTVVDPDSLLDHLDAEVPGTALAVNGELLRVIFQASSLPTASVRLLAALATYFGATGLAMEGVTARLLRGEDDPLTVDLQIELT